MLPFPLPTPLLTADLPGVGGRLKVEPEDFEVEEIPAYEPSGTGEHLFLWLEKRDLGAEFFQRQIAQRLALRPGDIGSAGLKDRRAVTRQWVSVPATAEPRLADLEGDGIRVLQVSRHGNKLRAGHLHGNRFAVRVRDVAPGAAALALPIVERLRRLGMPNFYGEQRFGNGGETARLAVSLLRGDSTRRPGHFLLKLALSAGQSLLFNEVLARRMADNLLGRVVPGDVMAKWPTGGLFVAENVDAEQARYDGREIVPTGPMFGKKMHPAARDEAEARERAVLRASGLPNDAFARWGKLLPGTRRPLVALLETLTLEEEPGSLRLRFELPAGSYATVLLREVMKADVAEAEAAEGELETEE